MQTRVYVTNEQDATSEGPPQVADVLVRNMVWTNTAQGLLCLYPEFQWSISSKVLAYDASDTSGSPTATSLMLALLRVDWSKFKKEDHARYLSPILDQISAQSLHIEEGFMGTQATSGSLQPKVCPVSLSIPSRRRRVLRATRPHTIRRDKISTAILLSCMAKQVQKTHSRRRSTLGLRIMPSNTTRKNVLQKTVMLDRLPHVLSVGMNTGEKNSLPDLRDPNTVLDGVELKFEHISGEERSVKYKTGQVSEDGYIKDRRGRLAGM
ncbi:hypothetical protein KCU93_g448, partial [Aureobasidium melanogenum]